MASLIFKEINKNEEYLKNKFGQYEDLNYRHIIIPAYDNSDALIVNINGMNDKREVDSTIVAPLTEKLQFNNNSLLKKNKDKITELLESGVFISAAKQSNVWDDLCNAIINGNTVLFVDNCDSALILTTRKFEHRTISEPLTETETRGARDGFNEILQSNIVLIRARVKDFSLRFENFKIGERTKTDVAIAYIETLVNDKILNELKKRLNRIDVDRILESANIEELIEDNPNSIFPQLEHTERPDKASAALLDGRIVILIDNTPFCLIVPTVFWNFIQPMGDNFERRFSATFLRFIRLSSLLLALSLSSLYVLLTSFHHEMLPTSFALKVAEGRTDVPFPAFLEAFAMEFALQVMKEAGLRMPQPIGQIVGIVGTFVIGQAAVAAGVVGPVLVIFIALAAICSFAIPQSEIGTTTRLLSYALLILTSLLGLFGFLGGLVLLFLYLLSLRSFGEPFLAPVFPHYKGGIKDIIVRPPMWKMTKRPRSARAKDTDSQTTRPQKPTPPKNN